MVDRYNPAEIEPKWQKIWEDAHCFEAKNDFTQKKFYALIEFPYPSGAGLHVGHPRSNTALDIISRKRRMEGYNVLFPMGYDAFGLPTENYAIKTGCHPRVVTETNVAKFREQLKRLGFSFDWSREINTTDPSYFKWTQWIFLQLFKRGLAYKAEMPINFCTSCKVGLANEEVVDGKCDRCGGEVVRKVKTQWMLKITAYAQRLIDNLDMVDFIDKVKTQQRNWIGRSEGAEIIFKLNHGDLTLKVFTTRPDTIFGATYMVISPEHPMIDSKSDVISNMDDIIAYREKAAKKSDFERSELSKEKTGVMLKGIMAINPATGLEIPIWISDYVLMGYGTGAIMAVPAHDMRDYDFAKAFDMPIVEVVSGGNIEREAFVECSTGTLVNSGFLNGLSVDEAKKAMINWLEENGLGTRKVNFKLRDWVFSRQRYWGEPIPLVYCEHCKRWVPLPEDQLPLMLPEVQEFKPSDMGESPLVHATEWINTTCPECGGPAKRETDIMPQWAGSSWYYMRYCDPHNDERLAAREALNYWLPVDWYNGGMEHTTLHLLYSRFWHKALYDLGVVDTPEPYLKRTSHGMVLGENGEKMSKSRGNVVNPDVLIDEIGADAFRMYEMFMGAFDQPIPWSTSGAKGCRRFLDRVWRLMDMAVDGGIRDQNKHLIHSTIKKVSEDIERMKFNTAIAALMSMVNEFYTMESVTKDELHMLLVLLSPVSPHICEEMNRLLGYTTPLYAETWPAWDESALVEASIEYGVQINGKVKARITAPAGTENSELEHIAIENADVKRLIEGLTVRKVIIVKNIINIVAK
ncbi:MAG: leucine--tRNA ligase [Clostridia bacterium]|nr:leucine--tRNA ligase [Clostridia bacterium]